MLVMVMELKNILKWRAMIDYFFKVIMGRDGFKQLWVVRFVEVDKLRQKSQVRFDFSITFYWRIAIRVCKKPNFINQKSSSLLTKVLSKNWNYL